MKRYGMVKLGAVASTCVLAGAAAGIAGSTAAPTKHKQARTSHARARFGPGPGRGLERGGPVHSSAVVLNRAGTAFVTVMQDRGAFKSLAGDKLTITEGTKTVTYQDATLTIPANATVTRNDATAKLSDLQSGDQVSVFQSPEGTFVAAEDAAHQQGEGFDHRGGPGGPPGGPTGPGGPDGPWHHGDGPPPPGAPPGP